MGVHYVGTLVLPHGFHKSTCKLRTASKNARAKRASFKHAWPFADLQSTLKCILCHVFFFSYKMKLQQQKAVRSHALPSCENKDETIAPLIRVEPLVLKHVELHERPSSSQA